MELDHFFICSDINAPECATIRSARCCLIDLGLIEGKSNKNAASVVPTILFIKPQRSISLYYKNSSNRGNKIKHFNFKTEL